MDPTSLSTLFPHASAHRPCFSIADTQTATTSKGGSGYVNGSLHKQTARLLVQAVSRKAERILLSVDSLAGESEELQRRPGIKRILLGVRGGGRTLLKAAFLGSLD